MCVKFPDTATGTDVRVYVDGVAGAIFHTSTRIGNIVFTNDAVDLGGQSATANKDSIDGRYGYVVFTSRGLLCRRLARHVAGPMRLCLCPVPPLQKPRTQCRIGVRQRHIGATEGLDPQATMTANVPHALERYWDRATDAMGSISRSP